MLHKSSVFPQATGSKIAEKKDLHWKVMSSPKSKAVLGYAHVREKAPVQNPNKLNKNNVYAKWIDTGIISPGDHVYQTNFDYPVHPKVLGSICKGTLSFGYAADDYVREIHLNGERVYSCGGACTTEDFFQMRSVHGWIKGENNTLQFVVHKSKNFMQFRDGHLKISTEGFVFQHDQIFVQLETCKKISNIENSDALITVSVMLCILLLAIYVYFIKFRKNSFDNVKLYTDSSQGSSKSSVAATSSSSSPIGTTHSLKSFPDAFLNRLRKTGFKVENMNKEGANKDQILFVNNKGDLMWSDRLFSSIQSLLNLKKVYSANLTGGFTMEFNTGITVHFKLKPSEHPFTNESMVVHFNAIMKQHREEHIFVQEMSENEVTSSNRDSIASNFTLEKSESLKPSSLSELVRTSSFSNSKRLSLSTSAVSESPQSEDKQGDQAKPASVVMSSLRKLSFRVSPSADGKHGEVSVTPSSPTAAASSAEKPAKPGFLSSLSSPSSSPRSDATAAAAAAVVDSGSLGLGGVETAPTFMNMLKLSVATKSSKSLSGDESSDKTPSVLTKLRSASPFARKSLTISSEDAVSVTGPVSVSPAQVDSPVASLIKRMSFNAGSRPPATAVAGDESPTIVNRTTSSTSMMTKLRTASPFARKHSKPTVDDTTSFTPAKGGIRGKSSIYGSTSVEETPAANNVTRTTSTPSIVTKIRAASPFERKLAEPSADMTSFTPAKGGIRGKGSIYG